MNTNLKLKIKNSSVIRFSAPAKVHIIGEHAVVYGKPAIISAINLRLRLTITPRPTVTPSNIPLPPDIGIHAIQNEIGSAIRKVYKLQTIPSYGYEIEYDFPIGSGLGASAAISATLTAAILKMLKIKADERQIYDLALAGEKAIHGNPSGSDLAAIVFGGTLWFRKELPSVSLTSPITLTLPTLYLIDSGKPKESTGDMVAKVAKLPAKTKKEIFDQLELLTRDLANGGDIKQIFKEANQCLIKLGVVSPSTQKLIKQIEKSGGSAKITGAGGNKSGSGMIIAYIPQPALLRKALLAGHPEKLKGVEFTKIKLAQEGLREETD